MWYKKYIWVIILLFFVNAHPVKPDAIAENFTIKLLIPSDNTKFDTIAQALTQFWTPLRIKVQTIGVTLPVYQSKLLSDDHDWDAAIFYYNFNFDNYPLLNKFYHPDYDLGSTLYQLNQSILEGINGDSKDKFLESLEYYDNSVEYIDRVSEAKKMQRIFNEELLYDIPLLNQPLLVSSLNGFEGFEIDEDLLHSIFLGASWGSIIGSRSEDRADDELVYAIPNIVKISNPLYTATREEDLISQSLYSTLFIEDQYNSIHPHLATGYSHKITDSSSEWNITIRDDVVWSDGHVLDAMDVKFTLDLNRFQWIQASNHDDWKNLEKVTVINQTMINVSFSKFSVIESSLFSSEFIIPEHIYNTSFTSSDGVTHFPYESGFPKDSQEWVSYSKNPVTAGPYVINLYKTGEFIELKANEHFWFPSESQLSKPLDINSNTKPGAYYFNYGDNPLTGQIEETNHLKIQTLNFQFSDQSIIDQNSVYLLYDAGKRDFIEFDRIDTTSKYLSDQNYQFYVKENKNSGIRILFNSQFDEVKAYDIRRALSLTINKTKISSVLGQGYRAQNTIVSNAFTDYYDDTSSLYYDFDEARDLFRANGLVAFDNTYAFSDAGEIISDIYAIPISILFLSVFKRRKVTQ
ncbi:MAG: hypothetical protein GPJ54_13940 [Candidatus Heimdallarchaeota archaeon]|nr:hypothetical protein [Candidatus Heimdallarchaeota archaeon]